jgi:hypothetical protein
MLGERSRLGKWEGWVFDDASARRRGLERVDRGGVGRLGSVRLCRLGRDVRSCYACVRVAGKVSTYIVVFWAAIRRSSSLTML